MGKAQVINLDAEGPDVFQLVIARVSQRLASGAVFEGVFLETAD